MRLPVLRFALVILCLPRTDGSEPFTGCQENAADDFFSTDLSSDLFPHNGYVTHPVAASGYSPTLPVPDEVCDLTIDVNYYPGKAKRAMLEIWKLGHKKVICVQPGTCEWPPFEPRSHLNPVGSADPMFSTVLCQTEVKYGLWLAPGLARR